ncbi:MAG: hypothetical protein AAF798_06720 [Bacteroidota bacterium]
MFSQHLTDQLFHNTPADTEKGRWYLILPSASTESSIDLQAAMQSHGGTLVFFSKAPNLEAAQQDSFVSAVLTIVKDREENRAIIWALSMEELSSKQVAFLGINKNGTTTTTGIINPSGQQHLITGKRPAAITVLDGGIRIGTPGQQAYDIAGTGGTGGSSKIDVLTLDFIGDKQGLLQFDIHLTDSLLASRYKMGFQMYIGLEDEKVATEEYPLCTSKGISMGFRGVIHPADIDNARHDIFEDMAATSVEAARASRVSYLEFTGTNEDGTPTVLESYYRTIFGKTVELWPVANNARLVLNKATNGFLYLSPEGNFSMGIKDSNADATFDLMGGLHGAEFFSFKPRVEGGYAGDQLQFVARQPAFAPVFPFPEASPLLPPIDPTQPLLTKQRVTSWAAVAAGEVGSPLYYVAQPRGAALYGFDDIVNQAAEAVLGHMTPGYSVHHSDTVAYPLLPYGGVRPSAAGNRFDEDEVQDFEFLLVAPVRRDLIGPALSQSAAGTLRMSRNTSSDEPIRVTNPNGVIIELQTNNGGSVWQEILIGQSGEGVNEISFVQPTDEVQQAFQNGSLFLVATNPSKLGALASNGASSGTLFKNEVTIGGWTLSAQVGQNDYGDYTNIVLFKGRKGAIYDPDPAKSLAANPGKWTQAADFSSPITRDNPSTPNDSQLSVLSNWIQRYCADGVAKADSTDDVAAQKYFKKFKKIVTDPNWQGLLILRMTTQFPDDLIGLKAGITDLDAFYAHHFGIAISQIKKENGTIVLKEPSAMFGLIYYEDPAYEEPAKGEEVQPVFPSTGDDYDFRLLTLKVLFENTAIKNFESYAQLTVNNLFQMPVQAMGPGGNTLNTLVLRGSYQDNNGKAVYSLGTISDYTFLFTNNVFNKIELTSAKLQTRTAADPDEANGINVCWFAMSGYLDFQCLKDPTLETPFDILSFGTPPDEEDLIPRQGLRFHNLGIEMRFSTPEDKTFAFSASEIRFDMARSTPREHSLVRDFSLDLNTLVIGRSDSEPSKQGYLSVQTDIPLTGVNGQPWYGLRCRVNLGTPGELAGKINLDAHLLLAWSPESKGENLYKVTVGMELPGTGGGAKLLDIQNVLKLSIGQIVLTYIPDEKRFLLMLTEIALKFLGLLKIPPGGATNFFLFGNSEANGDASALGWFAMYKKQEA